MNEKIENELKKAIDYCTENAFTSENKTVNLVFIRV